MKLAAFPMSELFAALKSCGVGNRYAAEALAIRDANIDGTPIGLLIESKAQLSRRIVHAAPGTIPAECFADFPSSARALTARIVERYAVDNCKGDLQRAARTLVRKMLPEHHKAMAAALTTYGYNAQLYRDAITHLKKLALDNPIDLLMLHILALVVAGCTADGYQAFSSVLAYATDALEAEYSTSETYIEISPALSRGGVKDQGISMFCIARLHDRGILAETQIHAIGPDGLTIGLLPRDEPAATDVDTDVSRRHARLWVEDGRLFICDLGSTNGTAVIAAGNGTPAIVAPPKSLQDVAIMQAIELHFGDIICLGATTRYIVLPAMER